jgi:hypothetical protein
MLDLVRKIFLKNTPLFKVLARIRTYPGWIFSGNGNQSF